MKLADLPKDAVIHEAGPPMPLGVYCWRCNRRLSNPPQTLPWPRRGDFVAIFGDGSQILVHDATEATCGGPER